MKDPTLHDVATLAGLSTGTVSKYINGAKVSPKNAARVKNAIEVLHYAPSPLARNFARGRSFDILLFIIVEHPIVASTWLHELPIIQGITDTLKDSPYSLKIAIASTDDSQANLAQIEHYSRGKYVDAIILLSPWEISENMLIALDYHAFPYVMVGSGKNSRKAGSIDFDNYAPIYEIVSGMHAAGHRDFAMIAGFSNQYYTRKRTSAFRDALQAFDILVTEQMIRYGDYSLESGLEITGELLASPRPPTAIVCCNDNIASGAIRAIQEAGLSVPDDIVVSGFDDTIVSDATKPTITSVRISSYELGRCAASELLKKLESSAYEIPNQIIPCNVVYKQSTAKTLEVPHSRP